jgi:ribosomal protein L23
MNYELMISLKHHKTPMGTKNIESFQELIKALTLTQKALMTFRSDKANIVFHFKFDLETMRPETKEFFYAFFVKVKSINEMTFSSRRQ